MTDVSNDAEGLAVMVGPVGYTVELTNSTQARYTAEGTVEQGGVFASSKKDSGSSRRCSPRTQSRPPSRPP